MYSLVSSPVIGFDLVRHPSGPAVASVLLEAFALDSRTAQLFDTSGVDDADRGTAWFEVEAGRGAGMSEALQAVREQIGGQQGAGHDGSTDSARRADGAEGAGHADSQPRADGLARSFDGVLSRLQSVGIGGLEDLLHLVRADILDWAPRDLATLACDAVAVAYAGGSLSRQASRRLAAPWLAGWQAVRRDSSEPAEPADPDAPGGSSAPPGEDLPRPGPHDGADLGPLDGELRALLDRAGRLTSAELAVLADPTPRAGPAPQGGGSWAQLVHEATWAVYLSGRLRPVAVAQLRLVHALRRSGVQAEMSTFGVWNVVSGCLQAVAVRDLLPDETFDALTGAWREKVGPLG